MFRNSHGADGAVEVVDRGAEVVREHRATVLVADGDAGCRALVSELFGRVGLFTREASSGYEALELAESSRPSLVLLDVELPGMSGYETCRELRDLYGETLPLVLLSGTRVEALDRIAGLLIGADDYIVKPFDPGELLARARLLLRRNGNGHEHRNGHSPSLDSLTPREREVLDLLAEGRSQDEIAQELFITPKTVATHIQRILGKLGVHSRAQAVAVALRNGIGEPEEDFVAHAQYHTLEPV